jgi:vacuolar-type H+-ATPase subunit D/Vma8
MKRHFATTKQRFSKLKQRKKKLQRRWRSITKALEKYYKDVGEVLQQRWNDLFLKKKGLKYLS